MSFYVAGSQTKAMPLKKRKKRNQVLNNLPKVNLDELVTFRCFQNGCFAAASFPMIEYLFVVYSLQKIFLFNSFRCLNYNVLLSAIRLCCRQTKMRRGGCWRTSRRIQKMRMPRISLKTPMMTKMSFRLVSSFQRWLFPITGADWCHGDKTIIWQFCFQLYIILMYWIVDDVLDLFVSCFIKSRRMSAQPVSQYMCCLCIHFYLQISKQKWVDVVFFHFYFLILTVNFSPYIKAYYNLFVYFGCMRNTAKLIKWFHRQEGVWSKV